MAVHSLIARLLVLALLLAAAGPAGACFGPKLYLGVPDDRAGAVLAELVALYVQEKTGVASELVVLDGRDPVDEIRQEHLDLAISAAHDSRLPELLGGEGIPVLLSGKRPLQDLQFTTVAPALRKLDGLLDAATFAALLRDVEAGEPPKARVRRLLMERGWI